MQAALAAAGEAAVRGEIPVGAIVSINNKIVATASNRTEELKDATAHAEILAIREASAKVQNWRLEDAILCVTLEPCTMCAGAIRNARIGTVIYGASDPERGALGSLYDIGHEARLGPSPRIIEGIMSQECTSILDSFFKRLRLKET